MGPSKEFAFISVIGFVDGYMRERFGKKSNDAIYVTLGVFLAMKEIITNFIDSKFQFRCAPSTESKDTDCICTKQCTCTGGMMYMRIKCHDV